MRKTIIFYFILFYFILFYSILFYSILFYFILFYYILFYSILFYSIIFYSILLYYIIFYYIILYYIILYYIPRQRPTCPVSTPIHWNRVRHKQFYVITFHNTKLRKQYYINHHTRIIIIKKVLNLPQLRWS